MYLFSNFQFSWVFLTENILTFVFLFLSWMLALSVLTEGDMLLVLTILIFFLKFFKDHMIQIGRAKIVAVQK